MPSYNKIKNKIKERKRKKHLKQWLDTIRSVDGINIEGLFEE